MVYLFSHFWWLIFPVMGMGIAYFRIWQEHQRQKKALEVLKVYAEKGVEPTPAMLDALGPKYAGTYRDAMSSGGGWRRRSAWPRAAFCAVMAVGFAAVGALGGGGAFGDLGPRVSFWAFYIPAFVFAAIAVSALVQALISRGRDDQ